MLKRPWFVINVRISTGWIAWKRFHGFIVFDLTIHLFNLQSAESRVNLTLQLLFYSLFLLQLFLRTLLWYFFCILYCIFFIFKISCSSSFVFYLYLILFFCILFRYSVSYLVLLYVVLFNCILSCSSVTILFFCILSCSSESIFFFCISFSTCSSEFYFGRIFNFNICCAFLFYFLFNLFLLLPPSSYLLTQS